VSCGHNRIKEIACDRQLVIDQHTLPDLTIKTQEIQLTNLTIIFVFKLKS